MLSEILDAAAPTKRAPRPNRPGGISMSSLFPCPYRLRLVHDGKYWGDSLTPQQHYNMADGNDQEEQSVKRLAAAGITIENRQKEVVVGRSKVPGAYDGDFELNGKRYLWEHKAYDQNTDAMWFLKQWGMAKLPEQRAQTNGYMLGGGLERADFFVKVKNNNTYIDIPYSIDRPFIDEIVEWCDRIRLDDWKPKPEECKWCTLCRVGCFDHLVDLSWIATADETKMVEKWKQGTQFIGIGKMLQEEADAVFIGIRDKEGKITQPGLIGDKELLVLPGLEIKKSTSHPFKLSKALVLQEFGPEGLIKVGTSNPVVQYRHKET